MKKTKIIIDTNVLISAFVFGGKAEKVLKSIEKNNLYQIYYSSSIKEEYLEKFLEGRVEKISLKAKVKFDLELAKQFINKFLSVSTITNPPTSLKINSCRDPEDNMILELAVFEEVDYIVTGDRDLLVLNPFKYSNKEFGIDCKIEIVDIKEFVELLEGN
jgi:uncharacterized protein